MKKAGRKHGAGIAAIGISISLILGNGIPVLGGPVKISGIPMKSGALVKKEWAATASNSLLPDYLATSSDSLRPDLLATASNSLLAAAGTGDFWKDWTGDMSFLSGATGKGTEKEPYQISTKAQLMGLSDLASRDMMVAEGEGKWPGNYEGTYFQLSKNIDLGGMDWLPIGFYRTEAEMLSGQIHPFQGHFDGNGKTVSNFRLYKPGWDHVGFFGAVEDSEVKNLILKPANVLTGKETAGLLAGSVKNSRIYNITVTGSLKASGTAGGAAGEITDRSVLENITADHVSVDTGREPETCTGGIAGKASDSLIVDCVVNTGDSLSARLLGGGYVGGITGFQNSTDIFNVHVMGTVGGSGSQAIGGITGKYAAGKLKAARFEGTVANSGLGSSAREGTFIGTREAGFHFRYGTENGADVAYLFADREAKISAGICGSGVADDNRYSYDAHIGYWHSGDNYYTLIQGNNSKSQNDRYFYEELEEGMLHVIDTEESLQEAGCMPDHFAPNASGRPVRGFLLSVLQIDAVSNMQNYYDVAVLTARGNSAYSHTLDKSHRGAIAAGDVVTVTTAPKNTELEKYQMEGVPSYIRADGKTGTMKYQAGGSYSFVMPECDTEISAVYKKVAANVRVAPEEMTFRVVQERKGDRKNPHIVTEVRDRDGKLIARYINGELEQGTQVQDVRAEAIVDQNNDVADSRVLWSIDDGELILLKRNPDEDEEGYTEKSASLELNLEAGFFNKIVKEAEEAQAARNFRYPIPDTIYGGGTGGIAVLTASTRPSASFEGKPLTANCKISVTFQIKDRTQVAAEGAALDKDSLSYQVTRTLEGDRLHPKETVTVTEPQSLTASFHPDFFDKKDVSWTSSDTGVVQVNAETFTDSGIAADYKNASVKAVKDARWIQNIITSDQGIHERDPYRKLEGRGSRNADITVSADDSLGNKQTASCRVTVNFITDDRTFIVPEEVSLDQNEISFDLSEGWADEKVISQEGFDEKTLSAKLFPMLAPNESHKPFNRKILWSSSDPSVLTVKDGVLTPVKDAKWIREAKKNPPYYGETAITVTAQAEGNPEAAAECQVRLTYRKRCVELDKKQMAFDLVLTKTGSRNRPVLTWTGGEAKGLSVQKYHADGEIVWSQLKNLLVIDESGNVTPKLDGDWLAEAQKKPPYEAEETDMIAAECGDFRDCCEVKLTFRVVDKTYSSSGGSSSGGSSSGNKGSSSSGITTSGSMKKVVEAPEGSVTGTWIQDGAGQWLFTGNGRTYANEWAYIHNPYAPEGQSSTDWFCFDENGYMRTGWYQQPETGKWYYLNPVSDGSKGKMMTGWIWVNGKYYYLDLVNGHLLVNATTPDGFYVNENGEWEAERVE